jgi:phosphocarrier protein HPr
MSASSETDTVESTVVLPAHLHARPAGRLAKAAARYQASVELVYEGKVANATGILGVMALGATRGTSITVRAQGADSRQAVDELTELLRGTD